MSNQNIALVLSGGGARGLAHIGVIEELERRGYTIFRRNGDLLIAVDVNAQIPVKREVSLRNLENNNGSYRKYLKMAQSRLDNYIPKNTYVQV